MLTAPCSITCPSEAQCCRALGPPKACIILHNYVWLPLPLRLSVRSKPNIAYMPHIVLVSYTWQHAQHHTCVMALVFIYMYCLHTHQLLQITLLLSKLVASIATFAPIFPMFSPLSHVRIIPKHSGALYTLPHVCLLQGDLSLSLTGWLGP